MRTDLAAPPVDRRARPVKLILAGGRDAGAADFEVDGPSEGGATMLHHPDNTTEDPPLLTQWSFFGAFSAVVALVNLFAIVAAAADRSWVAIGIALIYGPAANLIAAVAGTVIVLRRRGPDFPADGPMLLAWLLPIGLIGADFLVISSMSLGGC